MGKRGPPPTPTPILQLRGSWRGKLNRDEPQPEPVAPEKPGWIDGYASEAWDYLVPVLERMRVLTEADGKALTMLCITWSRWRQCEEFVAEHGEVYPIKDREGKTKELRRFPQAVAAETLGRALNRYLGEFGLTPATRSRIHVAPEVKAGQDDGHGGQYFRSA
jgi:P27 family predicted phage terminase small subunit